MDKENGWCLMTEATMVLEPIGKVFWVVIKAMIHGKEAGPSNVCAKMLSAIGKAGISVIMKLPRCVG